MIPRAVARSLRKTTSISTPARTVQLQPRSIIPSLANPTRPVKLSSSRPSQCQHSLRTLAPFHTSSNHRAQSPSADAIMENLNELYATAKDEFEIAAEETEKKTVYAADDREAAADALKTLQESYQKALKESSPEVSKEVQSRVGPRIRELENAVKAMEEMAMED